MLLAELHELGLEPVALRGALLGVAAELLDPRVVGCGGAARVAGRVRSRRARGGAPLRCLARWFSTMRTVLFFTDCARPASLWFCMVAAPAAGGSTAPAGGGASSSGATRSGAQRR